MRDVSHYGPRPANTFTKVISVSLSSTVYHILMRHEVSVVINNARKKREKRCLVSDVGLRARTCRWRLVESAEFKVAGVCVAGIE
ncbi:hypothetical protein E2C01_083943 [Portunus trituberculatus]|uniref:Uncharacterized protein n=1 Tax=Portunus trituberculatus TaxID=210409 RepID=A0A5B7J2P9_PORTR|nr:hypothetical protein [Portunus trituberculatus]